MMFTDKYSLITGASRGIGRGIALRLARGGARVAVHYFQNRAAAEETLDCVRELGSDGFIIQADVSQPDDIRHLLQTVQAEFGRLDIFVSNARPEVPTFFYPTMEINLEQWDMAVDSQAKAFLLVRGRRRVSCRMGVASWPSPTARAAARAACSPGWLWARPRRRCSRWYSISP